MNNYPKSISFVCKMLLGIFVFFCVFIISMLFGAADTSIKEVWLALSSNVQTNTVTMIREIRLPREVATVCVGAALAVSGAIMQGLTRNPLADPGLFGLTAGANAALALTIALIPSGELFCDYDCMLYWICNWCWNGVRHWRYEKRGFSPLRIVLAGAAISLFLYAIAEGIGIYFKISKDVSMWTAGGIIGTTWGNSK